MQSEKNLNVVSHMIVLNLYLLLFPALVRFTMLQVTRFVLTILICVFSEITNAFETFKV